jgi:DNA-binding response OmpR family regulator
MQAKAVREGRKWGQDHAHRMDDVAAVLAPTRVLLAEDDNEMRRMLATALRRDGYEVEEARDGCELLARVRSSLLSTDDGAPVELVVSDVRMPGWSGLEVLEKLREEDWAVPVILITAFGDEETRRKAREYGATLVLDKPFDVGDLCAAANFFAEPR